MVTMILLLRDSTLHDSIADLAKLSFSRRWQKLARKLLRFGCVLRLCVKISVLCTTLSLLLAPWPIRRAIISALFSVTKLRRVFVQDVYN